MEIPICDFVRLPIESSQKTIVFSLIGYLKLSTHVRSLSDSAFFGVSRLAYRSVSSLNPTDSWRTSLFQHITIRPARTNRPGHCLFPEEYPLAQKRCRQFNAPRWGEQQLLTVACIAFGIAFRHTVRTAHQSFLHENKFCQRAMPACHPHAFALQVGRATINKR